MKINSKCIAILGFALHCFGCESKSEKEPTPGIDLNKIAGLYTTEIDGLLKLTANTFERYSYRLGKENCPEPRPYTLVGSKIIVSSSEHCPSETWAISMMENANSKPLHLAHIGADGLAIVGDGMILSPIGELEASRYLASFNAFYESTPPGLQALLSKEATLEKIDAARKQFQDLLSRPTSLLLFIPLAEGDESIRAKKPNLVFNKGVVSSFSEKFLETTDGSWNLSSRGPSCVLNIKEVKAHNSEFLNSLEAPITSIELRSSRLDRGHWKISKDDLGQVKEVEQLNEQRTNQLIITLKSKVKADGSHDYDTIHCHKLQGPDVFTLDDLKLVFGDLAELMN